MSFCTNCGNQLEEGARFCTNCGTPVQGMQPESRVGQAPVQQAPVQQAPVQQAPMQQAGGYIPQPVGQPDGGRKKSRLPVILGIVAAVAVIGGGGAFAAHHFMAGNEEAAEEETEETRRRRSDKDETTEAAAAETTAAEMPATTAAAAETTAAEMPATTAAAAETTAAEMPATTAAAAETTAPAAATTAAAAETKAAAGSGSAGSALGMFKGKTAGAKTSETAGTASGTATGTAAPAAEAIDMTDPFTGEYETVRTHSVVRETNDDYRYIDTVSFEKFTLGDDAPAALRSSLDQVNGELEELAEEYYGENEDDYYFSANQYVKRADGGAYSAYIQLFEDTTDYLTVNLDPATGKMRHISYYVSDPDLLVKTAEKCFEVNREEGMAFDSEGLRNDLDADEVDYTVDVNGIDLYYKYYEWEYEGETERSYSTVHVPFGMAPEAFTEEAFIHPENYMTGLGVYLDESDEEDVLSYAEILEDGKMEELTFRPLPGDNDELAGVDVFIGDTKHTVDLRGYGFFSVQPFMFRKDGESYLYLSCSGMDDWSVRYAYKVLPDGDIDYIDEVADYISTEENWNPDRFLIVDSYDMFSTLGAKRWASLGSDGMPEPESLYYELDTSFPIQAKIDIDAEEIDAKTRKTKGSVTIPEGTELEFVGTDNKTFTDFRDPDGKIVRVTIESKETSDGWTRQTYQGMDLFDVFKYMQFAG